MYDFILPICLYHRSSSDTADDTFVNPMELDGPESSNDKENANMSMAFPSILHKDAFLIFRALCKLSMKGLHESNESGSTSDPIALQNK